MHRRYIQRAEPVMPQPPQIAIKERAQVGNPVFQHRDPVDAHPKREPLPLVRINPGELQQVIVNLLVNAAQAMGNDGVLSVSLSQTEDKGQAGACLCIGDTGPGIPDDNLDNLFDPFFTTKPAEGTGLGLSISQTLIRREGGHIRARNRNSGGAAFSIWLPEVLVD